MRPSIRALTNYHYAQALYIYLAWAVLIGCAVGFLLYAIYHIVEEGLQLSERYSLLEKSPKGPSQALESQWDLQWNEATSKQRSSQLHHDHFSATPTKEHAELGDLYAQWEERSKGFPSRKDAALISTTILEEEDDNHDFDD